MIWLPAGGSKSPPSGETIARGEHKIRMEGKETYRFATRTLASTALAAVGKAGLAPDGRRPVHPAPGERPDHRGRGQGPRPADGPDVRQPRPVRQHLGRVGADRARRGRRTRAASRSATSLVFVAFGAGFTSGAVAMEWTADPARGRGADDAVRPEDVTVRLPVDWDSVDPIPPALAEILARPLPVDLDLSDVVPGEPAHAQPVARLTARRRARHPQEGASHDRPDRQDRPRHGRLARDRQGDRAAPRRRQGADVAFSYRGNTEAAAATGAARWRRSAGAALAVQADATRAGGRRGARQGRARGVRQGRHPRQQRRHHARRPDHADERRGLDGGPRDEPVRRLLRPQGGAPGRCSRRAAGGSSTSRACPARPARWARRTTAPRRPG